MPHSRQQLGATGERLAASRLEEAGLVILDRNWRCSVGEIDIVAAEDAPDYSAAGELRRWLVLIEVRTRRGDRYGTAQQSITPSKAAKLREVGAHYVRDHGWSGSWRIDVVAVQLDEVGRLQEVDHIRGAVAGD